MMILAFDLDGTLYDTLPIALKTDNKIFQKMGYPKISKKKFIENLQTKDWKQFYRDLGIREEHLEQVINSYVNEVKNTEIPKLIPGAKEAISRAEQSLGIDNIYFITNESYSNVKNRFERDNLTDYLPRVRTSFEGKTEEIYKLARKNEPSLLNYIGDLVSDGEECKDAIKRGATNIRFYGVIHKHAMNPAESMKEFIKKNKCFASVLNNLEEIDKIWTP